MQCEYEGLKFSDTDVVDFDEWIPAGEYNPHNVRPWLIHHAFGTVAVVFASCEQDALDAAVDADKMGCFAVPDDDVAEYEAMGDDNPIAYLGNASEPFLLDDCGIIELPNPSASFCAQFASL